jgi:citrate lyase subunit beta / citryl-CoA lyase
MRSLLVIPSPSLSDFNAGLDSGADALVLNFEEAPLDTQELAARMSACMAVNITLFIKVHPLNHPAHFDDLRVAVEGGAAGVILSSCKGENITQLAARLAVA